MFRPAMVVEGRVRIITVVGSVMVVDRRLVAVGPRAPTSETMVGSVMAVGHRMVLAARPRTPVVVGPGMGVEPRMVGRRGIMVVRRVSTVARLVMCRSRRLDRGRGVLRMRTTCRMIMRPGRATVGVSREVMFLMLLGRNRMLISRIRLTSVLVTGHVRRGVGTMSSGPVLMPVILPNPEPTPHPTTIRVGTSIPVRTSIRVGIGVLMWMSIRVGIGVLMWMSIRVGISVPMWMSIRVGISVPMWMSIRVGTSIPMWMKTLAGVSIPVTGVVTVLMVVPMVWMIIVIRMRVLVLVVMGRIMEGRGRETIR